ncbi:hypothetical protein [Magnetospirillum sp. LM-5]|uniref:hypothetical protein n=1 Tax=Magnetospirillum sp. LM-5 TaxID=2681466 RepID=UPI00156EE9E8|nr:hypothetical protein [Magnetospirillum sp. LM-5]
MAKSFTGRDDVRLNIDLNHYARLPAAAIWMMTHGRWWRERGGAAPVSDSTRWGILTARKNYK